MDTATSEPANDGRTLRDFVRTIRTYWLGTLLIVAVSIGAGAGWTIVQPRVYQAGASGLVQAPKGNDPNNAYAADALSKSQAPSFAKVATSLAVAETVESTGEFGSSAQALLGRITALQPQNTAIIEISATGPSPESARTLADAWITAMSEQIKSLQGEDEGFGTVSTTFVSLAKASTPSAPISPNVPSALLISSIAGLLLAAGYAVIRQHLDRRIRSAERLEQRYGTAVLGTIPMNAFLSKGKQLVSQQADDTTESRHAAFGMAESLRELRTNLSYVDVDNPPQVFVVTSPNAGEGKTTISANLAETLAMNSGKNVVAIDCDLRRPSLSTIFNAVEGAGLTDVLSGRAQLHEVLQPCGDTGKLWVLSSGRIPPNPSELLGSRSMKELLAALGEHSIVVLDAPPILPVTDAVVLANSADGVVMVVSAQKTTYDHFERAQQLVKRGGAHLLGTVLNRVPVSGMNARGYGYYGGAYYSDDVKTASASQASSAASGEPQPTIPSSTAEIPQPVGSPTLSKTGPRRAARRTGA